MKYFIGLMLLLFASVSWANCTGCGDDGHQMCPIKKEMETEVVFAVCVFADGTLIDHKGADSMRDCLKTKRKGMELTRAHLKRHIVCIPNLVKKVLFD